jgi:polygalacturonase
MSAIKLSLIIALTLCSIAGNCRQKEYNITNYGAVAGFKTNNAVSIQKAIDLASTNGGGIVLIPAGFYITGPIVLKNNVNLHLDDNALLMGSNKRLDYPDDQLVVISAVNQQNISITGNGVIDGQGRELVENTLKLLRAGTIKDNEYLLKRPQGHRTGILAFRNCKNIIIKDITLKNAASWVQDYTQCTGLVIDHITVESTAYWNNDGIDIVDSKDVKIINSFINSADDGICLKSDDKNAMCENIYVADCTIRSSASAFKFGTGSVGGFKHIVARNLVVYDTFRSAIALESVDGAIIDDVDIRNVVAKNTGNAIFIRLGHRNKDDRFGAIKRVYIANVKAEIPNAKPDIGYPVEGPAPKVAPHNLPPSSIVGIPGHNVEDVVLENIEITYGGKSNKNLAYISTDSLDHVTENIAGYPEFTMFGEVPAYGFYVRHADKVIMKNIKIQLIEDDFRPAFIFDDVKAVEIHGLGLPASTVLPSIILNHVNNSVINGLLNSESQNAIKKQ